jgi:hypothetical protein
VSYCITNHINCNTISKFFSINFLKNKKTPVTAGFLSGNFLKGDARAVRGIFKAGGTVLVKIG